MKKFWNWLTSDFDNGYDNDPMWPTSFKDFLILVAGGLITISFFYGIYAALFLLECFIYGA
ncbi:hypothetical protein V757_00930 [Pelistega indica]|uniref:Uncharacterized protein n=1 Tax=Pelistega indica TaxID=1414851 RepID=V8G900_9BURK|nr:hypothetical protein [Pelistega indica]ETD72979.1 hypothetical protein V757_00930 [Pelistega indica]